MCDAWFICSVSVEANDEHSGIGDLVVKVYDVKDNKLIVDEVQEGQRDSDVCYT